MVTQVLSLEVIINQHGYQHLKSM